MPEETRSATHEDYAAMVRRFQPGARLSRIERLAGGTSAETLRLDILHPDGSEQALVCRRHGDVNHAHEPNIAENEFRLLAILRRLGLPVQAPGHVDRTGPFAARPCVVLDFIDGEPLTRPPDPIAFVETMADVLARLHAADVRAFRFLHRLDDDLRHWLDHPRRDPDESMRESLLRDTLRATTPPPSEPTLLHGDFWPGNILWRDGAIVGVIDWEDAAVGAPHADLAVARLELLWSLGEPAMLAFTERYVETAGLDRAGQPYWDLFAALRAAGRLGSWGFNGEAADAARRCHARFVDTALAAL